jgi:hypothetical protein
MISKHTELKFNINSLSLIDGESITIGYPKGSKNGKK